MGQKVFKSKTVNEAVEAGETANSSPSPKYTESEDKDVSSSTTISATKDEVKENDIEGATVDDVEKSPEKDVDLSKYTAPAPENIPPAEVSVFETDESALTIKLMPHQHTLFCERKVKIKSVCA